MTDIHDAEQTVAALQKQYSIALAKSKLPPLETIQAQLAAAQAQLDLAKTEKIERDLFLEKLKGKKGGGNFVSLPLTAEETAAREKQAALQEKLKRPNPRPGDPPPLTMEERKVALERERLKRSA